MLCHESLPGWPELRLLTLRVHRDGRGQFFEAWRDGFLQQATGQTLTFCQENQSRSHRGVVRGLHYQAPPHAQGKLIRVLQGRIFDVAVDLRRHSPRRGCWVSRELDANYPQWLWLPPGFAHGFMALEDDTLVTYKVTQPWVPAAERCLAWNDPLLNIRWPALDTIRLSERDANGLSWPAIDHAVAP